MEMKTRILLLGILSILYGLFVTDRKYPRTDKYGRMISLNIQSTQHGWGGAEAQPARTRGRRPSEERAGGGEGREGSHVQKTNV